MVYIVMYNDGNDFVLFGIHDTEIKANKEADNVSKHYS